MAGQAQAMYIRRDCINAVGAFMEKVSALQHAGVVLEGKYLSDRNMFQDLSQKEKPKVSDRGTKLGIVFGGAERDRTCYAFEIRDLSSKEGATQKSLRFKSVTAATSMPGNGIRDSVADHGVEKKLKRSTSRAANSMSFGAMFEGALRYIQAGSGEHAAIDHVRSAQASGGWGAVRGMLTSPDPLDAMAAWSAMGGALDGKADADDPRLTNAASSAMGLDALYGVLSEMDRRMEEDPSYQPDLSEYLDPDSPDGRRALRGVMSLSAYKSVRDRGGIDELDVNGKEIIGVSPDRLQVFDKLAFARADAETRRRDLAQAEEARRAVASPHCVQKTYAGIAQADGTQKDKKKKVDKHLEYRFLRSVMLGEDPDMPSGVPKMRLSVREGADIERLSGADIIAWVPGAQDGACSVVPFMSMVSAGLKDPSGPYGQIINAMPAMKSMAGRTGGMDALQDLAVARMQAAKPSGGGRELEGLVLEMAAFMDGTNRKGMARELAQADRMRDTFQENFQEYVKAAPRQQGSILDAVGRPDFAHGCESFGACWLHDAEQSGCRHDRTYDMGSASNEARMAESFLRMDDERRAVLDHVATAPGVQERPQNMAAAEMAAFLDPESSVCVYTQALARYKLEQERDNTAGSMKLNDLIVLTSCYHIWDADGLSQIVEGIDGVYAGTPADRMLYRPETREKESALRQVYASPGSDPRSAIVPACMQGTEDGFLSAMWAGAPDPAHNDLDRQAIEKACGKLEAGAADTDTFDDPGAYRLADRIAGPRVSEKALEVSRQAEKEALEAHGDRDVTD